MKFYQNFPRDMKETVLYMVIVSLISVNTIAPAITFCETGPSWQVYWGVLHVLPFMWLVVLACLVVTRYPAIHLKKFLTSDQDSYNAQLALDIMSNVFFMSMLMTVLGSWLGQGHLTTTIFTRYFMNWPRNFGIAFAIEGLVAQPIGRWIMRLIHRGQDAKRAAVENKL
ncbi:hypothetical protein [Limosilactobacillus caecicola]|uniref:hypothetical protein n=1 Tax=Limosilactobacillus caecicola TaxID=2941332 RepID=UPI00203C479F|nr:hypothetical protein [Limosilactobacillus caecicola]